MEMTSNMEKKQKWKRRHKFEEIQSINTPCEKESNHADLNGIFHQIYEK